MLTRKRPLQVACWALLLGFGLTSLAVITNPAKVRRNILAKAQRPPATLVEVPTLIAETEELHFDPSHTVHTRASTNDGNKFEPATEFRQETMGVAAASPKSVVSQATSSSPSSTPQDSWTVSSTRGEQRPLNQGTSDSSRTMIVVSPEQLRTEQARSREVELLPPPPELAMNDEEFWELDAAEPGFPLTSTNVHTQNTKRHSFSDERDYWSQDSENSPEMKLLVEQLDRLLQQQQRLLDKHQDLPIDRLHQIIDQLHRQLVTADKTFPPLPRDPESSPARSIEQSAQLTGEVSPSGNGRLSMSITNAELDDIIALLERLSGTRIKTSTATASGESTDPTQESPQHSLPTATNQIEIRPLSFR